jgi:hypothetical protein
MKTKVYHDDYMNITLWKVNKQYFFMYHETANQSQNNVLIPIESVARFIEEFLADRTNLLNPLVTNQMQAYINENNNKCYYLKASKLVELLHESPATLIEIFDYNPVNFDVTKLFLDISKCVKYIAEMARKGNGYAIQMLSFLTTGKKTGNNGTKDICPLQIKIIKEWDDDYLNFLKEIAEKNLTKYFILADKGNLIKQG